MTTDTLILSDEMRRLVDLARESGGLFDSAELHGASEDRFIFDPESLAKLVDLCGVGTIVGYQCKVDDGPWTLIDLDGYERVKNRPRHSFRPVYVKDSPEKNLDAELTALLEAVDIKIDLLPKQSDRYMVSAFPNSSRYQSAWFYVTGPTLAHCLSELRKKATSFGLMK